MSVTVRYVDVLVTDRTGDPITGLTKDDFEVYEDGVLQEITDFTERQLDRGAPTEEGDGQGEGEGRQEARDEHPYVVLLFDAKHMSFGEMDRPKKAAMKMLDGLLTQDTRAALLVLRDHLESVADFSEDHASLRRKVESMLWWDPKSADVRSLPSGPEDASPAASVGGGLSISLYPSYADLGPDATMFGVLEGLGRGLQRLRGPKTVVLFSEGVSGSLSDARVAAAYQRMIAALNDGNVAVMAIDAEGLRGRLGRSDRLFRALPQIGLLGGEGKSSLRAVAEQTGGDALIGSNNMAGWAKETLEARAQSYVIGYVPRTADGSGAYHQLEIKVRRRGAHVAARKGWKDEESQIDLPAEQRQERLRQEMDSWVLWRDLPVRMQNVAFPTSGKDSLVAIAVEMDARALRRKGRVAADVAGSLVEVKSRNIHDWMAQIDTEHADGDRMYYLKIMRLPWGTYVSKSVLRERRAGRMGASEVRAEVPRQTRVGPMMSQLAILDPNDEAPVMIDASSAAAGPAAELLTYKGRRLAPTFERVFPAGREIVLAYGIWGLSRDRRSNATKGTVVLTLMREGKRVREVRQDWTRGDGRGAETLQPLSSPISLAGLAPGDYELEARVTDRLVGAEAAQRIGLTVK